MKLDIKYEEFSDKSHSALKLLKCMCKILPSRRTILISESNLGNVKLNETPKLLGYVPRNGIHFVTSTIFRHGTSRKSDLVLKRRKVYW